MPQMAIQDFFKSHLKPDGQINWPEEVVDREQLARTIFLLGFVSSKDYWIRFADDLITCPKPQTPYVRPWSDYAKTDKNYRDLLATLTEEQRAVVQKLVRHVVGGALFSSLVSIDQFPRADVRIELVSTTNAPVDFCVQVAPGPEDLHDRFHELEQEFSDYPGVA